MLVLSGRLHDEIVFPGSPTVLRVLDIQSGAVRLGIEVPDQAVPATLPQFHQLVQKRLEVTRRGLVEMRLHLKAGRVEEAATVLDKIDEDLHLLRRRLRKEVETATPPAPALYGCASALSQPN
jgi:hypothetical protein